MLRTSPSKEHSRLQSAIGHQFSDVGLLERALTHRSHSKTHNERLEFVGDSVVNLVAAHLLFDCYPDYEEGELSRLRSRLVCREGLAVIAHRFDLGSCLKLGAGEEKSGGRERDSILSDALEAVAGAIALDTDFSRAVEIVRIWFEPELETLDTRHSKDPKTRLQEYLQGRGWKLPDYSLLRSQGKDHEQLFEVQCRVAELKLATNGSASSRKRAEQAAAAALLEKLESSSGG